MENMHEIQKKFDYINEFLDIDDLDTLLDKICEEVPKVINGKDCTIFLLPDLVKEFDGQLDTGNGQIIPASEINKAFIVLARTTREGLKCKIGKAFYSKGFGLTGWIFEKGKPLMAKDMRDKDELSRIDKNLSWTDAYKGAEVHFHGKTKMPFIGVPLIKHDTVLGVIRVGETFGDEEFAVFSRDVLMSFAGILANLIEKVTSEKNLRSSLESLINLGAMRKSEEIFKAVVNEAASLVGAENCELYYLNPYGEEIILHETTGGYMEALKKEDKCQPYHRGIGLTGWIFKTGKPLRVDNIYVFEKGYELTDPDLVEYSDGPVINCADKKINWLDQDNQFKKRNKPHPYFLGVPVKSDTGEVIGVLRVSSPKAKAIFKEHEMQLLQDFAKNISVLYHNDRQNKLYNVLIELGTIYEEKALFDYVVKVIPGLVFGRGCSIFLKEIVSDKTDKSEMLKLKYTSSQELKDGKDPNGKMIDLQYEIGQGKTGFVADIKRSLLINYYGRGETQKQKMKKDFSKYEESPNNHVRYLKNNKGKHVGIIIIFRRSIEGDFTLEELDKFNKFCEKNIYERSGLPSNKKKKCETGKGGFAQSYLAVPIKLKLKPEGEELLGVIRIPRTAEGVRFSYDDLLLVESITGRLTTVLEVQEKIKKISEILRDINSKINSSFDKDTILEDILLAITEKLGFEFATIQLVDNDLITTVKGIKNSNIKDAVDPKEWLGLAHPLNPPEEEKRDIHSHVLMELERDKIINGWDDHFDKEIYDEFNHKDLIRAFVPIIIVEPKTAKLIKLGTIEAGHNIKRKDFIDNQELEMLKAVANQVAITIWNREQIWSRVISIAAHQIRDHYTTILYDIESVLRGTYGALNNEQKKPLQAASTEIYNGKSLLNNLIELVRIIQKKEINDEYVDLSDFIENITHRFKYQLEANEISLTNNLQATGKKIWIDKNKIEQVITNLLGNAIKFIPKNRKGRITISTLYEPEYVKVIVKDNGKGFSQDEKRKIFQEFYQVDRFFGGTGLGLSIAENYIKLHGGDIEVESEVDQGASFIFNLPFNLPKKRERGG